MSLIKEFKTFIIRGNVIDLAVGIIIGSAFGKIVSSLVADILMPPIGLATGGVNFTDMKANIGGPFGKNVFLNYGNFLQATVDFIIVAAAIFFIVKLVNTFKKKEEAAPTAPPPADIILLTEIRDLLATGKRDGIQTSTPGVPGIPKA